MFDIRRDIGRVSELMLNAGLPKADQTTESYSDESMYLSNSDLANHDHVPSIIPGRPAASPSMPAPGIVNLTIPNRQEIKEIA